MAKDDRLIFSNGKGSGANVLTEIVRVTEAPIEATRIGKIALEDMTGGTFIISIPGPYGVRNFCLISNQPELAILGVCGMAETPAVRSGRIVIRTKMNLCLTAGHRAVDGVMTCKFMKRVTELPEDPCPLPVCVSENRQNEKDALRSL